MFTKIMGDLDMWSPKMLEPAVAMYGRDYLLQMMQEWHKAVSDFRDDGLSNTFKEGLARVTCPALAIHGEEDPVLGVEHAEFIRDNIKDSRLWIMPKGKHNLHLRYTDDFLKVVEKFLET
jgi:valacyclovir hydrolase